MPTIPRRIMKPGNSHNPNASNVMLSSRLEPCIDVEGKHLFGFRGVAATGDYQMKRHKEHSNNPFPHRLSLLVIHYCSLFFSLFLESMKTFLTPSLRYLLHTALATLGTVVSFTTFPLTKTENSFSNIFYFLLRFWNREVQLEQNSLPDLETATH